MNSVLLIITFFADYNGFWGGRTPFINNGNEVTTQSDVQSPIISGAPKIRYNQEFLNSIFYTIYFDKIIERYFFVVCKIATNLMTCI